jgi:hypothetical protein
MREKAALAPDQAWSETPFWLGDWDSRREGLDDVDPRAGTLNESLNHDRVPWGGDSKVFELQIV